MTTTDDTPVPDYPERLRLDRKGFLVIGAGQGMGRQTSHALASVGAKVFCVDVEEKLAREIADEVSGFAWCGDATRRPEVERMVADAERALGRVDGFVDILGQARWAPILDIDDDTFAYEFDICLRHALLASQVAGRRMAETGGGSMVFIASVSGFTAAPNHAAYGAMKAGLMAWVKSLAVELGPKKIRANAIAPGSILTPRIKAMLGEAQAQAGGRNVPLGRVGLPADIASAALFLSSELASYISGQTIVVDGGVMAKFPFEGPDLPSTTR